MDSGVEKTQEQELGKVFRCARCGVESSERTCFIVPEQYGRPPRDVRCITCEQRRLTPTTTRALLVVFGSVFWPLWLVVGLAPADVQLGAPTLIFACLLYPLAVLMHELGHAVTAYLVGLEVGGVGIGFGRVVWQLEIRGIPVRLHSWPVSGRVYLGAPNTHLLRTRLWFVTLMGPVTNLLLAWATAIWWKPLAAYLGSPVVYLWWTVNLFLGVLQLYPKRGRDANYFVPVLSDGLALLQIPRWKAEKLEFYLYSAPLTGALARYEHGDFGGALSFITRALARTPNIVMLRQIQAASLLDAGEYQSGIDVVKPLLRDSATQSAITRAALQVNLAFGLVMSNVGASAEKPELQEAERLSREALDAYPCLLEFRATRALVLAATGRAEEALRILDYVHFDTGTPRQRAQRQTARAAALRILNRMQEAEEAARLAVQLDRASLKIVQSLGFSPKPGAKVVEPRPKVRPVALALDEELEPLGAGGAVLARVAGAVLLMFGASLGVLAGVGVLRRIESFAGVDRTAIVFIAVLGLLAAFCLAVGYRLALNRPNRYGSMLSPTAWALLAGLFGVAGLGFGATTFATKGPLRGALLAGVSALMLAVLCWRKRAAMVNRSS
jgi:tetratricopeptide (TPR) repeat protein